MFLTLNIPPRQEGSLRKNFVIHVLVILACFGAVTSQELAKQQIQSYAKCQIDQDCTENSFCFGNDDIKAGTCKCLEGYELSRNTTFYECLPGAKLGEVCLRDWQCHVTASSLSFCNSSGICDCQTGAHTAPNNQCFETMGLTQTCSHDYNCYFGDTKYGYCHVGKCSCALKEKPWQNNTICIPARRLGEICTADEQCEEPNQRCNDICRCKPYHVLNRNETFCLKTASAFEDECELDSQCSRALTDSLCLNGTCTCADDYHALEKKCYVSKRVGTYCEEDNQCIYESKLKNNVKCEMAVCTCTFGTDTAGLCNLERFDDGSSSHLHTSKLGLVLGLFVLALLRFQ